MAHSISILTIQNTSLQRSEYKGSKGLKSPTIDQDFVLKCQRDTSHTRDVFGPASTRTHHLSMGGCFCSGPQILVKEYSQALRLESCPSYQCLYLINV